MCVKNYVSLFCCQQNSVEYLPSSLIGCRSSGSTSSRSGRFHLLVVDEEAGLSDLDDNKLEPSNIKIKHHRVYHLPLSLFTIVRTIYHCLSGRRIHISSTKDRKKIKSRSRNIYKIS